MLRGLSLAALLLAAPLAVAQDVVSLSAGPVEFDLSGTGSAVVVDLRAQRAVLPFLAVEAGLGYSQTDQQFGDVTYLLPAVELQATPSAWRVRPTLGAGVGLFLPVASEETVDPLYAGYSYDPPAEGAVVLSLGLDADVTPRVLARFAGRIRGTLGDGPDVFVGTFAEVTAGVGLRL